METLLAKISIQETVIEPQPQEKPPKIGQVFPGLTLKFPITPKTICLLKITAIEAKLVKFYTENLLLKSKPDTQGPIDFGLAPGQSDTLFFKVEDVIHEFKISVLEIFPKPISSPTPKITMPMHYFDKVQSILQKLETDLSSKVIVYYLPGNVYINQLDPDYFTELLTNITKCPKISLIVYSAGGDSMASLRIATILHHYCEELDIIIPSKGTSAATILSLSADKILFTPLGYLGPIDTQLVPITDERLTQWTYNQISSDSFRRAKEMLETEIQNQPPEKRNTGAYSELFKYIHPLVVAEVDRLSSRSKQTARTMLKMHKNPFDDTKIEWISNHLVYDYPSHGYPILFNEAKNIGLNVEMLPDAISNTLWDLLKYYRAITLEKLTNLSTEWYHIERNEVVIEAVGKRIVRRYSFDRKLSPLEKKWQTSNDNSNWKKYLPPEKPGDPPRILRVEVEEKVSIPTGVFPTSLPNNP